MEELTIKVPDDDTDTLLDSDTASDGVVVVELLLSLKSCSGRDGGTDVKLGKDDLNTKIDEGLDVGLESGLARRLADDEVRLETDTVDLDATGLEAADEDIVSSSGLGAGSLDVVVVVVELDAEVVVLDRALGLRESLVEIFRTDDLVEDTAVVPSAGWVVSQSLVDDVPRVAVVAEVGNGLIDMVLHGGEKGLVGPWSGRVGDVVGELALPDEVVATDLLAGGLGDADELVTTSKVSDVLLRLNEHPLHDVGRSGLTKVVDVVELGHVVGVLSLAGARDISGSTEPELAGGLGSIVQTGVGRGSSGLVSNGRVGVDRGGGSRAGA